MNIKKRGSQKDNKSLVVLIHGLGAPETWKNDWENLILNDQELVGVDLGIVSYDTSHLISGFLKISGTLQLGNREITISEDKVTKIEILARELKRELDLRHTRQYENIILVGHSMGGLIGIHYLLQEIENRNPTRVNGYLSLATPFNGAPLSQFYKLFKRVQNHDQIKQLRANDDFLDETIRLWQTHLDSPEIHDIDFKFCYGIDDEIVEHNSAIPYISGRKWTSGVPLSGTHGGILDVTEGYESSVYVQLRDHVLNVCERNFGSSLEIQDEDSTLDVTITHYEQNFNLYIGNNLGDKLDLELVLHNTSSKTVTVWEILLKRGSNCISLDLGEELIVLGPGVSRKKKFSIRKSESVNSPEDVIERVVSYGITQTLIVKDNNKNEISKIILDNQGVNGVKKDEAFKPINVDEKIQNILNKFGKKYKDKFRR
ncbi:alpha/beta fold hydrolase [Halobacillus salinus]|nr:alpha/beta fold hydrolase [Halobacillus salinus]